MRSRSRPPVLLTTCALAWISVACGSESTTSDASSTPEVDAGSQPVDTGVVVDTGVPSDSGVVPDTGPVDTGPRDCTSNPFNCRPMQLTDDQCRCLPECEGDLVWNPSTSMCEPPFAGACGQSSDCPGPDDVCLAPPAGPGQSFVTCGGEATCACFTGCDPFTEPQRSGCPADASGAPQACAHLITPDLEADAICVQPGMGGVQGDACSQAMTCNRNSNHFCIGLTQTNPSGVCQRLCDMQDPTFCSTVAPGLVCSSAGVQEFPNLGLCSPPPVPVTDFGTSCTDNAQCAGICSQVLNGCSASCRAPDRCGAGSTCITFNGMVPPGEESICFVDCPSADATGDGACRARNPGWVCRQLVDNISALCSPPCGVIGCPMARPTCNAATGRCE